MDRYWERTIPFFQIDVAIATTLVPLVDSHFELEDIKLLSDGKRNTNYKITGKEFQPKHQLCVYTEPDDSWQRECIIYKSMNQYISIPELYDCGYHEEIHIRPFVIFEYINVITLDYFLWDNFKFTHKKLFHQIGEGLSYIHQAKYNNIGFLNFALEVKQIFPPLRVWYDLFLTECTRQKLEVLRVNRIQRLIERYRDTIDRMSDSYTVISDRRISSFPEIPVII